MPEVYLKLTEHQARYFGWVARNYGPGKCRVCGEPHDGYHAYRTHMQTAHPNENQQFEQWAGIQSTVDSGGTS